jgi:transcription elongation factor Elf1
MQIINKTITCPACGCICLPDVYHCPKCGKSFILNKDRTTNDTLTPVPCATISRTDTTPVPQFSHHYTIYVDMVDQERAIIILKN